ncbi:MAG: 30S ribosomal protein S9 [Thermoplasmata archaeon]|jgi:small subunit ribosomal protein S9
MENKVIVATGKRKTAVARAVIKQGNGNVRINHVPIDLYRPEILRPLIKEPLLLIGEKANQIDINVNVHGGGIMGQTEAARTAIARAIVKFFDDPTIEKIYREYNRTLIVNDIRRKLPKQPRGRGARAKVQKSYR